MLNKRNDATPNLRDVNDEKQWPLILEKLEEVNQLDLKLYEFAQKNFFDNPLNRTFPISGFSSSFPQFIKSGDPSPRFTNSLDRDGHCLFGPYITLGSGRYTCQFDISLISAQSASPGDKVASLDVHTGIQGQLTTLAFKDISLADFNHKESLKVELEFYLENTSENMEFRVYCADKCASQH